jgi:hypothetical protein
MRTLQIRLRDNVVAASPLNGGIALSATVAMFYALCTLVWVAAPGPFVGFVSSLFHGIDFAPLVRPAPLSWGGFAQALLVMAAWAFLAGTFYGWLRRRLGE